jgi:hypothetical protein
MIMIGADSDGNTLLDENYFEAWRVDRNSDRIGTAAFEMADEFENEENGGFLESGADTWSTGSTNGENGEVLTSPKYDNTRGVLTFIGNAKYMAPVTFDSLNNKMPFGGGAHAAGSLPSIQGPVEPEFAGAKSSNTVTRIITISWCCLPGSTPEDRKSKMLIKYP